MNNGAYPERERDGVNGSSHKKHKIYRHIGDVPYSEELSISVRQNHVSSIEGGVHYLEGPL